MADSSFDIVSKVDHQEVDNALNQAAKEVSQRYDFKNVGASIAWSGENVEMRANSEERVKAILDVFESKLIKRGVSLKALDLGEPFASGKEYRLVASLKQGIGSGRRQEAVQDHPGRGAQGGQGPDPGRRAAGQLEVEGRAADRDRTDQGQGPGVRGPVRQLPVTNAPSWSRSRIRPVTPAAGATSSGDQDSASNGQTSMQIPQYMHSA